MSLIEKLWLMSFDLQALHERDTITRRPLQDHECLTESVDAEIELAIPVQLPTSSIEAIAHSHQVTISDVPDVDHDRRRFVITVGGRLKTDSKIIF